MTLDVVDLISSSPPAPPTSRRPQRQAQAPPSPFYNAACKLGASDSEGVSTSINSVPPPAFAITSSWLSDGDDCIDDFDKPNSDRSPVKKRRRLSASAIELESSPLPLLSQARSRKSNVSQPPLLNTNNTRHRRTDPDPIQFTSSLEPPSATNHRHVWPLQTTISSQKCVAETANFLPSSDFDPFASSPQPQPQAALNRTNKVNPQPTLIELSDQLDGNKKNPALGKSPCKVNAASFPVATGRNSPGSSRRSPPRRTTLYFDLIPSSAPEASSSNFSPPPRDTRVTPAVISITDSDLEDGVEDDEEEFPDVADIDVSKFKPRLRSPLQRSRSDIVNSKIRPKISRTVTRKTFEQRQREREAKSATREADKERKRTEREETKEMRAHEKQRAAAIAEVNKIRTDKKVSTPEMIVDLPSSLGSELKVQVEILLEGLSVQHSAYESQIDNAIKWRRKVASRFDESLGRWEPIPQRIELDNHVLVVVSANEFVDMAISDELDSHVDKIKQYFKGYHITYLLEGITPWMRKNRNARNRQFASGVRSQQLQSQAEAQAPPSSSRGSRKKSARPVQDFISEDIVEDSMLRLQVEHDVLIHHTTIPMETAQWITAFTQHISTIPYKRQKERATSAAGFCMESGQVRTGDDAKDTYVRMLQEIVRVTAPIAYGIAAEFNTVSELVVGLEVGGPARLDAVKKSANKDGAFSDRTIGPAVSKRLHKVFTGQEETSTEV